MWPNPQEIVNLVTFTEEILNGKLNFLCSASNRIIIGSTLDQNDNNIVKTILYGLDSLSHTQTTSILNAMMEFFICYNRFEEHLH